MYDVVVDDGGGNLAFARRHGPAYDGAASDTSSGKATLRERLHEGPGCLQQHIEQVYLKADRSGAVILLETESGDEAERQLATLPLVQRGVTSFEVTELVPVT